MFFNKSKRIDEIKQLRALGVRAYKCKGWGVEFNENLPDPIIVPRNAGKTHFQGKTHIENNEKARSKDGEIKEFVVDENVEDLIINDPLRWQQRVVSEATHGKNKKMKVETA